MQKKETTMQNIIFIINHAPYGNEIPYNALRLALALSKNDTRVRVFLLGDGVWAAQSGKRKGDRLLFTKKYNKFFDKGEFHEESKIYDINCRPGSWFPLFSPYRGGGYLPCLRSLLPGQSNTLLSRKIIRRKNLLFLKKS